MRFTASCSPLETRKDEEQISDEPKANVVLFRVV